MAEELLSDVERELGTLLRGTDGRLKNEDLKRKLSFNFPTLHANIQEAEAMSLTPKKRGSTEWTEMLTKFLELKEFVYEVEDRLDKLRIEDLISQELRNDLIARVSSMARHRQGPHPQPKPDKQGNTHLMTRVLNKVRNFFLSGWHSKFRLNFTFTDLEGKLNTQFPCISVVTENSKSPGDLNVVGSDENSESDDQSSYSSLAKHLKLCFKYFSLIPKGYWIEKAVLTQLWMAEGFTNLEEEETAENWFDDLMLGASLAKDIEKDEDGNIVRCKIHERLHDFICHLSEDEFSVITDTDGLPLKPYSLHSSLCCINIIPTVDSFNPKKMRTLLCFGSPSNLKALSDLYSHLKFLRVLDLSLSIIEELPADSVAKLEHLRYLNLSYTQIKKLPACICNLYLLQTLKLSHSLLSELPRETWKLQKLRHLEIDGTPMNRLPPGIWRLNKIRKLSEFIVGGDGGCRIEELANLEHLQGRFIISHLGRVIDQEDAKTAKLDTKHGIKHLILDGEKHLSSRNLQHKRRFNSLLLEHEHMCNKDEFELVDDSEIKRVERVFEGINPHSGLKRLEIWNYFGSKLPTWLVASLSGLVSLKLAKWLNMDHMPYLGTLPSLKFLHIYDMVKVRSIETRDLKGFSKLEQLTLEKLPGWEEWKLELAEGDLPCFLELTLSNCPKLKNLPALPQTLRKLEIHDCKEIEWNDRSPPLPTLEYLVVKGKVGNMCSLPNAPKLMSLTVALSPEMTSFPNGFNKLESLSALNIHFCPRLRSLPEELKQLNNLKRLHIAGCRLEDWSKKNKEVLKKIPNVEVDNKVLPSGCSYDGDDIRNGKGNDYDHGDSGYGKEHAYDDDNSSEEDDDD